MKKLNLSAVMAAAVLFVACTDQAYNLGRIDTTVGTHVNIKLPVGSIGQITFGDLLDFGEDNDILKVDADGSYRLVVEGCDETFSMEVPEINIGPMHGYAENKSMIPEILQGEVGSAGDPDFLIINNEVEVPCIINFEEDIDNTILCGIGRAEFENANFTCRFTVNIGNATIKAGATLTYPDYMTIAALDDDVTVEDGHIVRFNKDCKSGQGIRFCCTAMDLGRLPEGQGIVDAGGSRMLVMSNLITFKGKVTARRGDFTTIPEALILSYEYEIEKATMKSIEVKCDFSDFIEDISIETGDISDIFSDDYCFDIANPCLSMTMTNESPVDMTIAADIYSQQRGETYCSLNLPADKMQFPAATTTDVFVSARGSGHSAPSVEIVDPAVRDMLKKLPDNILISNVRVAPVQEYFTVTPGQTIDFGVKAGIDTKLEFGPEMKLPCSLDINGFTITVGDDIKCNAPEAKITFDIINSIPASISLGAHATEYEGIPDEEGTYVPCDAVKVQVNGKVEAGTLDTPSTNHIELICSADSLKALESMAGICLDLVVASNSSSAGEPLNSNHGIKVENIKVFFEGDVEGRL